MGMGLCPICHKEIPSNSSFCPYCTFQFNTNPRDKSWRDQKVEKVQREAGTYQELPPRTETRPSQKREYLAVISNVSSRDPGGIYELYVADHRFVLLKLQPRTSSWTAGGGLLGAAIAAGVDRARKKSYDPSLPLDARVGLDKDNYVLPYDRIQRIAPNRGMLGLGKEIEVSYLDEKGKTRKVYYTFSKDPGVFGRALSEIAVLKGKIDSAVPGYE